MASWSCRAAVADWFAGHDPHRSHPTVRQATVKTPNPEPEELDPVVENYEWVRADDVAPNGTTPVSGRHDRERSGPRKRKN